jgi:uncharacterized protein (TIGR02118 family)
MVKLVATFRRPSDPDAWMARFFTEQLPMLKELPLLERVELSSPFDSLGPLPGGRQDRRGPPLLMAELYFADRAAFDQAMVSDEGRRRMEALEAFAGDDMALFLADVSAP